MSKPDAIQTTTEMLRIRDEMRRFFSEHYAARIEPFLEAIRRWTEQSGKPVAEVALHVARVTEKHGGGMDLGLAIAAGVEAMEEAGRANGTEATR